MKKNRNTFEQYQEEKQVRREGIIRNYLKSLAGSRVKFSYITDLAQMVAMHIGQVESRACNKATLLRNKRYKALLLSHMASHLSGGTKNLDSYEVTDERAKALLTTAQLDVGNFRRENERLKGYVSLLEKEAEGRQNIVSLTATEPVVAALNQKVEETHMKFVRTCQALHAVLGYLDTVLSTDPEKHSIIDLSRMRDNVVVQAPITTPFFEWLEANRNLG